jgi:hypothetical protein
MLHSCISFAALVVQSGVEVAAAQQTFAALAVQLGMEVADVLRASPL